MFVGRNEQTGVKPELPPRLVGRAELVVSLFLVRLRCYGSFGRGFVPAYGLATMFVGRNEQTGVKPELPPRLVGRAELVVSLGLGPFALLRQFWARLCSGLRFGDDVCRP